MGRFKAVHILPLIHLAICSIAILAYLLPPQLQFLGILWVVLNIVDFPISAVTVALAWWNGVLAGAWIVIIGTLWWYFLSVAGSFLRRKIRP